MNDIAFFCQRVGFRTEVTAVFTDAMRALAAIGEERTLHAAVCAYLENPNMKAADAAAPLAAVAERLGLSPYTLNALFIMKVYLLGKDAYIARYSEEIFWDTAADLVCKTDECIASDDAVGTFDLSWFHLLMRGTIVALGRLQYHTVPFRMERYEGHGLTLSKGDPVINIHIPSSGKLTEEMCHDSYRRAYTHFKPQFSGEVLPFVCHSWLLYKRNEEFFPAGSNIARFATDFEILDSYPDDSHDVWRVFGKRYTDYTCLPRSTRLQSALADFLQAGNSLGHGYGFFAHNGKELLRS